ncbi:MAG: hypothetical protein DRJ03_31885 [Chloroflexi bacterium]|nr:MAG: hypothetical protein DRJ03_31885 [Chloroflexota bacterium]
MKRTLCIKVSIVLALGFSLVAALLWLMGGSIASVTAAPAPLAAPNASATELHVCPSGCAYSSVQAAVDAANESDVIKVAAGTYTGVSARNGVTQAVYISKTVTIRGGYTTSDWDTCDPDANPTTLDAQGQGRVLYITGDISPTIEGLRITGGDSGKIVPCGGIYVATATTTIRDNHVFSNTAHRGGGLCVFGGTAILTGNTIFSNTAGLHGGGLLLNDDSSTLIGNTIFSNTCENGGGGLNLYESNATLKDNTIFGNVGVGLQLFDSAATLTGNTVTANTGGGIELTHDAYPLSGHPTLVNNVIADNTDWGLDIFISSPYLLHNTIARNDGGIHVTGGSSSYSTVSMTSTILVNHSVGISVTGGNTITVNGILWDSGTPITVSQSTTATVVVQNQHTGDPAFTSDGYHITPASAALDAGVDAGVTTDIDDHYRPYNSTPDLGADELIATTVPTDVESTLTYTDTQGLVTTVQVPSGAVTEEITLVYTPVETSTVPSDFVFAGHTFDLDAYRSGSLLSGFTFSVPVTITLHYADADIAGLDEDSLVLEYWNGSAWVDAACGAYDRHPNENWLAVPICHLSRFALFGEREYFIYLPLVLRNYQ